MNRTPRPSAGIVLALVLVVCVVGATLATGQDAGGERVDPEAGVVTLEDDSELWPYTSREPDASGRTLPINLVVYGDPELTEALLRAASDGDWEEVVADRQDVAPAETAGATNATIVGWRGASGATRYTHAASENGSGVWMQETYQLHDGDFLGARHHVRAYVDPVGDHWTAMQAHDEHWDWFHVRHTVHGVEDSQTHVEAEFVDRPYVGEVHRERFANRGADADGWVTVVRIDLPIQYLAGLLLLGSFGAVGRAKVRDALRRLYVDEPIGRVGRSLAVVCGVVGWYAAVRFGAIWAERTFSDLDPWTVVHVGYPVLVVGMPTVTYLAARRLEANRAFTAGVLGFTLAVLVDYTYLGVSVLPIETIVHRTALAVAIGFVAAGASTTARAPDVEPGHVRTGVLLWLVALALPLLQFV